MTSSEELRRAVVEAEAHEIAELVRADLCDWLATYQAEAPLALGRAKAAEKLDIDESTLDRLVTAGRITPSRLLSGKPLFLVSELDRALREWQRDPDELRRVG